MKITLTYFSALLLLGTSLTQADDAPAKEAEPAAAETDEVKEAAAETEAAGTTLEITGNDLLQFSTKELKAKAGEKVTLSFKHIGALPKTAMGHNVVILKDGVDMAAFAGQCITAAATGYVPQDEASQDKIVASTTMLGGGESDEISFTAPEAGEYAFLCTFPGHYAIMNGKLIVE